MPRSYRPVLRSARPDVRPLRPVRPDPNPTRPRRLTSLVALAWFAALTLTPPACAADLTVVVNNVKTSDGALMIALFAAEADYPDRALRSLQMPATAPQSRIHLSDLPPGSYAIRMYHDRNGNGRLDSNLLGIPKEPYGFSGRSGLRIGPPGWDEAHFALPDAGAAIDIHLND